MDELTFLLILAGIGVVLLVAMFTYYKHHKKINDEIKDFNHHAHDMDDVLLSGNTTKDMETDEQLPGSFSASRQDVFDLDDIQLKHDNSTNIPDAVPPRPEDKPDEVNTEINNERELVDGVYINSRRVISSTPSQAAVKHKPVVNKTPQNQSIQNQTIKVVYDPLPDGVKELIISHTILSRGEYFTGDQLFSALESAGLSYGEMNIYHYPGSDDAETFALFSVANVVEPGTFDPQQAEALKTPGISMFMRLPTRTGSYEAYEEFIHVAQLIAADLDGELCDETRSQLTQQAISYKKEQIRKLNFDMTKAEKLAGSTH